MIFDEVQLFPMARQAIKYLVADGRYEAMKDSFVKRKPLGDAIHRKIMKIFRTYMVVGGMPQAVEAYVTGKIFAQIDFIKRFRSSLKIKTLILSFLW